MEAAQYRIAQTGFNDYSTYIRKKFGERVQKLSLNTGFSCPNRDGTKGTGGCSYCNTHSFRPDYVKSFKSISQQLEEGIQFFRHKYPSLQYLAYFQSYTNTYAELCDLLPLWEEALRFPKVRGMVIATRPDCLTEEMIECLTDLARKHYVSVELGIESCNNFTLDKVNRCHSWEDTVSAFDQLKARNLHVGGHYILGFPWEKREEVSQQAFLLSQLPLTSLKLHHLQVLTHTPLAQEWQQEQWAFPTVEEYMEMVIEFVCHLRPDIVIQRLIAEAPPESVLCPQWNGVKNYAFTDRLRKELLRRKMYQGMMYGGN